MASVSRRGLESPETRFSGARSVSFKYVSRSIVLLYVKLLISVIPCVRRFCRRTLRLWKYDSPALESCMSTPLPEGNCGNGSRSWLSATVDPFRFELFGSNPWNGLVTEPVSRLITGWSREGCVLRYWRGIGFKFRSVI